MYAKLSSGATGLTVCVWAFIYVPLLCVWAAKALERLGVWQVYRLDQSSLVAYVIDAKILCAGSSTVKPVLSGHSKRRPKIIF